MTRSLMLGALAVSLVICAFTQEAEAVGFGPVFKYAYHAGSYTESDDEDDIDYEADLFGFGLQLDTNVARDDLFNYRVEFMFELVDTKIDYDEFGGDIFNPQLQPNLDQDVEGYGGSINQTFGFGIVRTRRMRLFVGPAIRIGVWSGSSDQNSVGQREVDYFGLDVGIGPEIGLNVHVTDRISVSTTVAYIAGAGVIATDDPRRSFAGMRNTDYGYVGFNNRVTVGVSVLYRTAGDIFE